MRKMFKWISSIIIILLIIAGGFFYLSKQSDNDSNVNSDDSENLTDNENVLEEVSINQANENEFSNLETSDDDFREIDSAIEEIE